MSTLTVSNVSDGTLSIPTTYVTNGSAKAWVNFDGTGTIAARDSLNVSSLTDNGTGNYTVNFTNAFGAADYATVTNTVAGNGSIYAPSGGEATTSVDVGTYSGASRIDRDKVNAIVIGDLA